MPYVTNKKRYWMTPSEAVAHVCEAEHCLAEEAHKQILQALTDDNIKARWGDIEPIDDDSDYYADEGKGFRSRIPAYGSQGLYWNDTLIYWDTGMTICPDTERANSVRQYDAKRDGNDNPTPLNELRPLLLRRESVEGIWKLDVSAKTLKAKPKVIDQPPKSKADKKAEKDKKILEAAQKLIDTNNSPAQITWLKFNEKVRTEIWGTGKGPIPRGYKDDTIENLVRPFLEGK